MREISAYRDMVDRSLESQLLRIHSIPEKLQEAMLYSYLAEGKRLRPVLLLASCEAGGRDPEEAIPYACALEMIHAYSLIHDDLPCMDDDDERRGRPTNHVVYGAGMATLAGDALLNSAAELMLLEAVERQDFRGAEAAHAILHRSGAAGMIKGQVYDITLEGQPVTEKNVMRIHMHKTADLIMAGMEAGMLLSGHRADEMAISALEYGRHLGLAFQQMDDLLDVIGDEKKLGKKTGMDAVMGKQTWVSLRGIEQTKKDIKQVTDKAIYNAAGMGESGQFFVDFALRLLNRQS
ncbi:MAG: polyprenyl synthetase family protein [Clostridia bacterium]|nr:polyprenyl synthetase family protein [Clostridia bacterium]